MSIGCPDFAYCSKVTRVCMYALGKTSSIKVSRFEPVKNFNPALRCVFQSSPSELMIPWPQSLLAISLI